MVETVEMSSFPALVSTALDSSNQLAAYARLVGAPTA